MTDTTAAEHDDHAGSEVEHHGAEGHPSESTYVKVAGILAVVTAIEVGLYYVDIGDLSNTALLVLMLFKFVMVAGFFMHLKFDNRVLRRLFITGFILASFCYIAYLLTLGVFIG